MHAAFLHDRTSQKVLKKATTHEMFLGVPSNNSSIRTFGCPMYSHMHKATFILKLADQAQLGIYSATRNSLFRVHLLRSNRFIETKHATFYDTWYLCQKMEEYLSLEEPSYDAREE